MRFHGGRPTLRLYIVAAAASVVDALRVIFAIDERTTILGSASGLDEAEIGRLRPDVILLDIDGLGEPIETAIDRCETVSPQSRICVLSINSRARIMQRALSARAAGYVVKDTPPAMLVDIVRSIARGEYYADPRIAGSVLRRRTIRKPVDPILSNREIEIVRLIADGLSNREIGARIALSEKTVKNHVSVILAKLKMTARASVAVYAVRNGIVA